VGYVDDAFQKLKETLEITKSEEDLASRRHREIREYLHGELDLSDDFLTGSYRRETKTKRLKDVDIFIVLNPDGANGEWRDRAPRRVLEDLAAVLRRRYPSVSIGRRSCTVEFGKDEEIMSFDVVPAFEHRDGGYEIPDRTSGDWVRTDPTIHADLATKKNGACGKNWIPFVKMAKGWNRHAEGPVKPSFLLEVMALDLVKEPFGRYQDEMRWFLASAADHIMDRWPDPANLGPDVNQMDTAEKTAAKRALTEALEVAEEAVRLEDAGLDRAAVEEWRKLFGWRMPRP
jgi:hypothetical protein